MAEVDAALLTDDLPPAAYADPGFVQFLKTSGHEPSRSDAPAQRPHASFPLAWRAFAAASAVRAVLALACWAAPRPARLSRPSRAAAHAARPQPSDAAPNPYAQPAAGKAGRRTAPSRAWSELTPAQQQALEPLAAHLGHA